jgi:hypothetical protein
MTRVEETVKPGRGWIRGTAASSILVVLLVGACGSFNAEASTSSSTKSILASAIAAARRETGCTYTTTFTLDDHAYVLAATSGSTSGEQLITYNGATIDVREVDDTVYIKANAAGVKLQFGSPDPTWANRWIEVPSSDAKFSAFASGVLLGSTLNEVAPAKIKGSAKSATLNGTKVIVITGMPNSLIGLDAGTETLFLAAKSPNLPLKLVVTDKPTSEVRKLTISFMNWGKKVNVNAPPSATLITKTNLPN